MFLSFWNECIFCLTCFAETSVFAGRMNLLAFTSYGTLTFPLITLQVMAGVVKDPQPHPPPMPTAHVPQCHIPTALGHPQGW